jgi:hypothetical protein
MYTSAVAGLYKWIYVKIKKHACQFIFLLIGFFCQKKNLLLGDMFSD